MGFLDQLREKQAHVMSERCLSIVHMREQWLGQRVTVYHPGLAAQVASEGAYVEASEDRGWVFGELVELNDYGDVRVAYAVGLRGEVYYKRMRLEDLGRTCLLADP